VGQFRSADGLVLLGGRKLGPWISCRSRGGGKLHRIAREVRCQIHKKGLLVGAPIKRRCGANPAFARSSRTETVKANRTDDQSIYLPVELTLRAFMLTLLWMRVQAHCWAFSARARMEGACNGSISSAENEIWRR
jgi:hypothetical protein